MKKNEILKIFGTDFKEMTKEILRAGDAKALIPSADTSIGIKPNLVSESTPEYGATTHAEILAGIIEYLREEGFNNICILEGSWVGSKTSDTFSLCKYDRLCEEYDVPFYDLKKDKTTKVSCCGMNIKICRRALDLGFLINVPVLKGHCQTRMTCALKNMKGVLPDSEKMRFHVMGLHKPIAHLNTGIHQGLIVVDNICGDLDYEDGGNPVVRNCIMLARDPVLLDAYGCRLLKRDINEVKYIGIAEKLGVGSADLSTAEVKTIRQTKDWGDKALPNFDRTVELKDAVWEIDSCSACYGSLLPALQKLKDEGLFEKLDQKICIGQGYRGESGKLGVGNCTKKFECFIPGCPARQKDIYNGLKKYILNRG